MNSIGFSPIFVLTTLTKSFTILANEYSFSSKTSSLDSSADISRILSIIFKRFPPAMDISFM